ELRGGEVDVDRDRDERDANATASATLTARSDDSGTRWTIGRATNVRKASRPTAAISDRNMTHRAISSDGVAAVSLSEGMTNCGGQRRDPGGSPARGHVSERAPRRVARPTIERTSARPAAISAMTSSVLLPPPPPPNELSDSTVGAGVSELSGPDHDTTEPSEYVCWTVNL